MTELIDNSLCEEIAVIGIGRAGCTIVSKLPEHTQKIVKTFYIHSQNKYLLENNYKNNISIEIPETKDFGTNGEAYLGHNCAKYNQNKILSKLSAYRFIFIIAGLGGGTGSGATPYIAGILKEKGILCVSIVSFPFHFEGERKNRVALSSYGRIKNSSDSIILIDNNKILEDNFIISNGVFDFTDKFISAVIYGLAGLIVKPGLVDINIEDFETAIKMMGISVVGFGTSSGKNRAASATNKSIKNSQVFRKFHKHSIKSFIVSITVGMDMGINEFDEIGEVIQQFSADDANVVVGVTIDPEMSGNIEVIIIVSGFVDTIDTTSVSNIPYNEIFKSITFEPEHIQAGTSILLYFGEVLKQKYSNIDAKIRIERNDNSVTLIVESSTGIIEKIEKSLDTHEEIIIGEKSVSNSISNTIDIERLKMKLEISKIEVKHSQNIINLYKNEKESTDKRVTTLEEEVKKLYGLLEISLKGSNDKKI
jgi:cell division protein FtsZ